MRKVKRWDGTEAMAYQDADLEKLGPVFAIAETKWVYEWNRLGAIDEGTCCGGKGLEVLYIGKGCRKPSYKMVVRCNFVQGNVAAAKSRYPAVEYLKTEGVDVSYNDGWMD